MKPFDWCRDELILALDVYLRVRPTSPDRRMQEVKELSEILRAARLHQTAGRPPNFRTPDSIVMKLMNFRSLDPSFRGRGLSAGSASDRAVWAEFAEDAGRTARTAACIRAALSAGSSGGDEPDVDAEASEGRVLTRLHFSRERNGRLREKKIAAVLKLKGELTCEVCDFSFEKVYGERGTRFIECHHVVPLSELTPGSKTKLNDLALICANCHRMIHVRRPWVGVADMRSIIGSNVAAMTKTTDREKKI
ncbi:MAG: HNH endonuclease [Alphaproteobacteria bacterium]|nr:HNH endonuclease [Alphaproteobacteria bacterium]